MQKLSLTTLFIALFAGQAAANFNMSVMVDGVLKNFNDLFVDGPEIEMRNMTRVEEFVNSTSIAPLLNMTAVDKYMSYVPYKNGTEFLSLIADTTPQNQTNIEKIYTLLNSTSNVTIQSPMPMESPMPIPSPPQNSGEGRFVSAMLFAIPLYLCVM
jgi:hypothetical protein